MAFGLERHWQIRAVALSLAAAIALAIIGLAGGALRSFDERVSDLIWRFAPIRAEERRLVIVDIDEASLAAVGPWPWPRDVLARLIEGIDGLGARLQILDIVLAEPRAGDDQLAAALRRAPAVLGQLFSLDPAVRVASGSPAGALGGMACQPPIPQTAGHIANAADIVAVGRPVGHLTPRISSDGTVRHIPPLVCHEGLVYPALALTAVAAALGQPAGWTLERGGSWSDPAWWLRLPGQAGFNVPIDGHGNLRVSYRLPRNAFVSVSAAEVLAGRAPADLFRGAWILVGATAFGVGDAVPTPLGELVAGVEVHAQLIPALLDHRLPVEPRSGSVLKLLAAGLAAVLLLGLSVRPGRLTVVGLPVAGLALAMVAFAAHATLVLTAGLWVGWIEPALFAFLGGVSLAIGEHARSRFERERVFANLSSYLPAAVAREVALVLPSGAIDARRAEITVLAADLRNFSAYCEGRPPEEAAALLHAFFSRVVRVVEAHGGIVEGFHGDAAIAVWNAPVPCADHTVRALKAARELLAQVPALFPDPPPSGLEPLAIGVGLETGTALVGSVGPANRRQHMALGDTVTVAVRLQSLTADLAHPVLIGPGAAAQLPPGELLSLGDFLLEGLRRTYTVYTVPAPPPGIAGA